MKTAVHAMLLAAVVGLAAFGLALLGFYDVSAIRKDPAPLEWLLSSTMKKSVERRARKIAPPTYLDDSERIQAGSGAYDDMCRTCHGAPGVDPSVIGEGLNPPPPELATAAADWSDGELFWIIENGIRMTGMPAFGISHDDRELWDLVAFVRRISKMSSEEYERLVEEPRGSAHSHSHSGAASD